MFKACIFLAFFSLSMQLSAQDWPNLNRYKEANEQLGAPSPGEKRIVLMGNSITEGWVGNDPGFFNEYKLIGRGISGQTTPQMVLRFRQDVIDLKPEAVFILAGINDIAGNTGPSTLKMIGDNIENMAMLAKAEGIKVILCSILPANRIAWRDNMDPSEKVKEMNDWIKVYASNHQFGYLDYYSLLVDDKNGLPEKYSKDGVHPTLEGYKIMEKAMIPFINKIRQ